MRSTLLNDHNVYILGAGFSRARGLPLINDFMVAMRDALPWCNEQRWKNEAQAIEDVLAFRMNASSAAYRIRIDLENIEDLFSLAAAMPKDISTSIRTAIAATLRFREKTRAIPMVGFSADLTQLKRFSRHAKPRPMDVKEADFEMPFYDFAVWALGGSENATGAPVRNSFVSFNYDTILESSFRVLDVPFSYRFGRSRSDKTINTSSAKETSILKLHGSVNWAIPKGSRSQFSVFEDYDQLRAQNFVAELIPPSWRKEFTGSIRNVWEAARYEISRATRLVVIGFSVPETDQHFKYLLAAGIQDNISLREIVFVDPSAEAVEVNARRMFSELQRPTFPIRFVAKRLEQFVVQGQDNGSIWGIGRSLPSSIQNVYLR
jgi:SIR2-like domain